MAETRVHKGGLPPAGWELVPGNPKLIRPIKVTLKDGRDGVDGKDGIDGRDGLDGKDGRDGIDGKDGRDGIDGKDGRDGVDGKDGRDGKDGERGPRGERGLKGDKGDDGESAYQIAVRNGFKGTEQQWLASLRGKSERITQVITSGGGNNIAPPPAPTGIQSIQAGFGIDVDDTDPANPIISATGGGGGGGSTTTLQPATTITPYRVVTTDAAGKAVHADASVIGHLGRVIGVAVDAVANVQEFGLVTNPAWAWTPQSVLFLGLGGNLTQDGNIGVFAQQVATAITATTIKVNIGTPVRRA